MPVMGRKALYAAYASLAINVYYYSLMSYIGSVTDSGEELAVLSRYFPIVPPANNLIFPTLFTFASIMIFGLHDFSNRNLRMALILLQVVALAFYLLQLM